MTSTRQRTLAIGLGIGVLGLAHILLDRGRGAPAQAIWPLLAGIVPVYLASRGEGTSAGRGASLGAVAGGTAGLVVLLLGTPLLLWMHHPHPSLTLGTLALRAAVGLLNAAIYGLCLAALAGLLAGRIFGRRAEGEQGARTDAQNHFWRQFRVLFVAGLVGILSLLLVLPDLLRGRPLPAGAPDLSPALLAVLSLVNPTLLLAVAVAVGIRLAPRLGFRSHLARRAVAADEPSSRLAAEVPRAAAAGGAVSVLVVLLDAAFRRAGLADPISVERSWSVSQLISGMLYGGVTEELMLRWGLLTVLAWLGWRVAQRSTGAPRPWIVWCAIVVAALLFGAGHLPIAAATMTLTVARAAHIVVLNALAGVVFGWLYWRHSLEAAMIAHAIGHVVFALAYLAGELFPALA